jgi:hypothetical protein
MSDGKQSSAIMARKQAEGEIEVIIHRLELETGLLVVECQDVCAKLQDHTGRVSKVYHSVNITLNLGV